MNIIEYRNIIKQKNIIGLKVLVLCVYALIYKVACIQATGNANSDGLSTSLWTAGETTSEDIFS